MHVDLGSGPGFENLLGRLRATPTQRLLETLAVRLLQTDFVPSLRDRDRAVERVQAANPELEVDVVRTLLDRTVWEPLQAGHGESVREEKERPIRVSVAVYSPRWDGEAAELSYTTLVSGSFEPVRPAPTRSRSGRSTAAVATTNERTETASATDRPRQERAQ